MKKRTPARLNTVTAVPVTKPKRVKNGIVMNIPNKKCSIFTDNELLSTKLPKEIAHTLKISYPVNQNRNGM